MTDTEKMKEALQFAAGIFRDYELIHLAKNPPDRAKAERNGEYALKMEEALEDRTAPPVDGWLPISSAPRDGTPVLFTKEGGIEIGFMDWCHHVADYYPSNSDAEVLSPTHWMPLPNPPIDK